MPGASYRFGPFFADRTAYQVVRGTDALDLTPKLLDLLFYLLDHPADLVTKEELLDSLWPDANVTDNALAQAVSELRQALGDEAGAPQFIKTVARRGYRFIAPVERVERTDSAAPKINQARPAELPSVSAADEDSDHTIAVMDFINVTGDTDSAWLSAGIPETVTGDLRTLGSFRVVDRWRVMEVARRSQGSLQEVAAELGARLMVVGSFQRNGARIRITARVVDNVRGDAVADAKVDGPVDTIFDLQDQIVAQFSKELGVAFARPHRPRRGARETPSLEAFRAFTEGWLRLETLDVREMPKAIVDFERAIAADERYAAAYTGLASAEYGSYESSRSDNEPDQDLLDRAIAHARRGVALDDSLAEAHGTLALVLASTRNTQEALQSARRAVAIEPTNWRHFFRLSHAAWGDERLRAGAKTLALYPDFAFAHFQMAMVHVARNHLSEAEAVLRQGAAVQDRQIGRGERYPALGLHWLLGLVRLAQDDVDEALAEFDRERQLASPHRLYAREYAMHALHAGGAALLGAGRPDAAIERFRRALDLYPAHAQTHLGLSLALRALKREADADRALSETTRILGILTRTRHVEAAVVRSHVLAAAGNAEEAVACLDRLLAEAPAGFAGWTLPVEPLIKQLVDNTAFMPLLYRLAERAR